MSDSEVVQTIVSFDIEIEEITPDHPLAYLASTDEPPEATERQLTEQEAGMIQEETKEEELKDNIKQEILDNIKQEILDEPEDSERVEESLAPCQYTLLYRYQDCDNGATTSTQVQAEENKDGEDKPKRRADFETGEGGSGVEESGEGTSVKKIKLEEPSNDILE